MAEKQVGQRKRLSLGPAVRKMSAQGRGQRGPHPPRLPRWAQQQDRAGQAQGERPAAEDNVLTARTPRGQSRREGSERQPVAEFAGQERKLPRQPVGCSRAGEQAEGEAAQGDGGKEPAYHAGEYARDGGTEARRTQRETRRGRSANHPERPGRDQTGTGRPGSSGSKRLSILPDLPGLPVSRLEGLV